jgi:hypothetical protein
MHRTLRTYAGILLTVLTTQVTIAQRASIGDTSLTRALNDYRLATQRMDLGRVMDMVHPTLFEVFPREAMVAAMESTFNDPEVPMRIDTVLIEGTKGPVEQKGIAYHLIRYETHLRLHSAADSTGNGDPARQKDQDDALLGTFQAMYGKGSVRFDDASRDYLIRTPNTMFAIKDPALGDWRFVGYKPEMGELMDRMVPAKVRKKLGVK